jgi:tRNA dimethylallyltransferase
MAQRAIGEALAAGRIPVIVGGTGFYISALVRPLWEEPSLEPARRVAIQQALAGESTDELRRWCNALDPARAHLGRAQLLRAIEVALLTGHRLSEQHASKARPQVYTPSYLLVDPGTELQARIASRAAAMFDAGWQEEVRALIDVVPEDAPAWNATGYGVVRDLVRGALDRDTAMERVVIESRQYAKRQRTWFRHQLERGRVHRLMPNASGWQEAVEHWVHTVEESMRRTARET